MTTAIRLCPWTALMIACTAQGGQKEPADRLDGPPIVTCKGWAIGDGKSGQLLWGCNASTPMKTASTTKIMCALVVLQLASADPRVLDETLTFSKLADSTRGSTADVRAGERLTVDACLYGLLLPSGNDMGVALAEHFNRRLAPPDQGNREAVLHSRSNFIAEMNRAAKRLGLRETIYRSPFGDGQRPEDMTTSPRDLLTLAWKAMQDPRFRRRVSTARHECDVQQPDGAPRHVVWENTNQLLKREGYDGVKSGTTASAGCCLVASGRRGEDHLLLVVLGSTSNDARYGDTRNLFRWAWTQRGHK